MIRYLQGRSLGEVGISKPAVVSPVDRKARRELLPWSRLAIDDDLDYRRD